jgi:hypothetical protein
LSTDLGECHCAFAAHSQVAQLSSAEIEKRNAAAAFVSVQEASLFLLLGECSQLMVNSSAPMDAVARGWFDRNKPEMEAAYGWLDRYFSHLKTAPEAHQKASMELARATSKGVLETARVFFARKQPDGESCEKAAKTYSVPQLDLKNMALNPGYERFSEFPATLARIRAESDFSVSPHLKFGMDKVAQSIVGVGNLASLDAAEAAKERGDGRGRIAIFKRLAERGDGQAAQQIGIIYLNGQQVEKNPVDAYRWFYAAWSLSEMEGINAIGVMARDAVGVPVNLPLAAASFYVAKAAARSREAFDRASRNLERLGGRISHEEKSQMSCMSLRSLDDALRAPIVGYDPLVKAKSISNPERRLGAVVKDLADVYKTAGCQ